MISITLLITFLGGVLRLAVQTDAQTYSTSSLADVITALATVRQPLNTSYNATYITEGSSGDGSPVMGRDNRPPCKFSQAFNMTGQWMRSPDPSFNGFYNMTADCPPYASQGDCANPGHWAAAGANFVTPEFINAQFSQVFRPDDCALWDFNPGNFDKQMKGRRLLLLGDSLMHGNWGSLACLLRDYIASGGGAQWTPDNTNLAPGNYSVQWDTTTRNVVKQWAGNFALKSGGTVVIRDHSYYQQQLFDDIMAEWQPLTSRDILLISYGGWYPRFGDGDDQPDWKAFQDHVTHLFRDRLATWPGQVIWKAYTPQHFGGPFGMDSMVESIAGDWQVECQPASVGEFWYDDFVRGVLNSTCGDACKGIKVLPIYEMTRQRPYLHHGAFGTGVDIGMADCKHYCNAMSDWWNVVLYNMLFV